MTREWTPGDTDEACRLYLSGLSAIRVARALGVRDGRVRAALDECGIPLRRKTIENVAALHGRYLAGECSRDIAESIGITDGSIRAAFKRAGLPLRSGSEARRLRMARLTPAERSANAAAAHAAMRGVKRPADELLRRALAREARGGFDSERERVIAGWLEERGIAVIPKQAIGPYNVDFAAAPVVMEVFGGGWHNAGQHAANHQPRTRHLLESGWHVVVIWCDKGTNLLTTAAADYLISFVGVARSHPDMPREYRVIRGGGEEIARCGVEAERFPLKPSRRRRP